jgi:hypothetical protein
MRFNSSRQESPASTRTVVFELEITVLLPLEPEASTVMRMSLRYAVCSPNASASAGSHAALLRKSGSEILAFLMSP